MEVSHPDNSELNKSMEGLSGMDKFSAYRNHKLGIMEQSEDKKLRKMSPDQKLHYQAKKAIKYFSKA
jgi:hypothetical protein